VKKDGVEWLRGGRCLPHPRCITHMASLCAGSVGGTTSAAGVDGRPTWRDRVREVDHFRIEMMSKIVVWAVAGCRFEGESELKDPSERFVLCHSSITRDMTTYGLHI